jgi:hypothetical protein
MHKRQKHDNKRRYFLLFPLISYSSFLISLTIDEFLICQINSVEFLTGNKYLEDKKTKDRISKVILWQLCGAEGCLAPAAFRSSSPTHCHCRDQDYWVFFLLGGL